jgi:hypothetical protein
VTDKTTFVATFPGIQSAIKVHGQGDGMRIQLDIPEKEMPNAVAILGWRHRRALRVTIEAIDPGLVVAEVDADDLDDWFVSSPLSPGDDST